MSAPAGTKAPDAGPLSAPKLEALAELCRSFHVHTLDVFGSALTGRFDPERSDLDFLVEFDQPAPDARIDWFGFEQALEALFGRPVDVLTRLPTNPYVRRSVEATRRRVFPTCERLLTPTDAAMTEKNPAGYVWDALEAAKTLQEFTSGRSLNDYLSDRMLRAAVERQFEIVGEALAALRRLDPAVAARVPELPKVVAFRNIIAHLYYDIDHEKVWENVEKHLPGLKDLLELLLSELGGP